VDRQDELGRATRHEDAKLRRRPRQHRVPDCARQLNHQWPRLGSRN
jgi:hypothetical protein